MTPPTPHGGSYECPKCGHGAYEAGELRASGGFLSKLFDVQRQKFTTVSCEGCGYTELYRGDSSLLGDVVDFLSQ